MPGGGGGGREPPLAPPLNGGELLLQLLQNPPHLPSLQPQPPPPQHQPPQFLSHDPAVAALGPSHTTPLTPHIHHSSNLPPPWLHNLQHHKSPPHPFAPHHFFVQNLNPNSSHNLNVNPASSPGVNFRHHQNAQGYKFSRLADVGKLSFLGSQPNDNHKKPSSAQHHQQQEQKDLIFGTLMGNNEYVINGNNAGQNSSLISHQHGNKGKMRMPFAMEGKEVTLARLNGLEVENHQSPGAVDYRRQGHNENNYRAAVPPPGFPGNQMGGNREYENRRNFGQTEERGISSYVDFGRHGHKGQNKNHRERERVFVSKNERNTGDMLNRRVGDQLDFPGPTPGSNFDSVSSSDIEESMMQLQREDAGQRRETMGIGMRENVMDDYKVHSDLDDLEEQLVDSLSLEDESGEGINNKKSRGTRDKDYRSDERGQSILGQRMRYMKRQMLWRADIDRLDAPLVAIYESLIPPEEEKAKQKQLLSLLEKVVGKEWPDARLYIYGSCANSFGFSKSDIDVCLTLDDADASKSEVLLKLADMLQTENLQNVQALTRARVPIVKLMDPATSISCDICVNNVLAVVNTKLLWNYAQIDVRLRQLAFIVKHWAKTRGVNETYQGTLSSYAYVLMCIHFLQQRRPPILPCLQTTHYVTVDGVVCAYFDQVEHLVGFGFNNRESIAQLVWSFFNYWAYRHDYTNDVISVRTGSTLSKRFKDWTRRIGNDRHLICIEDPFEVTHDLGRVVDKRSIKVLREEFERAAEILQYDFNPCVKLFEPYIPT